jgi:biotin synthase
MTHADIRHDWTTDDIVALLERPLLDLVFEAQAVHRRHNPANTVQLATLLSIKTGGCPEDCGYCPQSAHYQTNVEKEKLIAVEEVVEAAKRAKETGASRLCMGAAWRSPREGEQFETVLEMVRGIKSVGIEACVTLGMLTADQARRLAEAGLDAYNHNIDTSPEFYGEIISTRTFDDRLRTLDHVREAGITLCTGGIIGMGEGIVDRARMLEVLATMNPHPESVPINALVAVEGTPLASRGPVDPLEMVRMCAVARILMPKARVRLSAGRERLGREAQVLCFMAGANSIFYGEKLLTTGNPAVEADMKLLADIGAVPLEVGIEDAESHRRAREPLADAAAGAAVPA